MKQVPVNKKLPFILLLLVLSAPLLSRAQVDSVLNFSGKAILSIDKKYDALNDRMDKQLAKALSRFAKQEKKLQKKLVAKDSSAVALFAGTQEQYNKLQQQLKNPLQGKRIANYIPGLDSLQTASKFLEQSVVLNSNKLGEVKQLSGDLQKLEGNLYSAEQIEAFIKQRKELLTSQLEKYGMTKELTNFKKEVYYYRQQIEEYKNIFHDQKMLEEKALATLRQLPSFQSFMQKNSYLAQLFPSAGASAASDPIAAIAGLQTRASVQSILQERLGATALPTPSGAAGAAANPLDQSMQAAQQQLNTLKDKVNKLGGASSDIEQPDFKPKTQKTKTFLQRLEPGIIIQSGGSSKWLPSIMDLGLSLGYRLSDKSTLGIKAAYKAGFGHPLKDIHFSSEGVNIGVFCDAKLKGSFWISGGAEYNYMQSFKSLRELHSNVNVWQQSALLGISKKVKTGKRTSNVQLLYDFLWKQQAPQSQPLKFRAGVGL
ncbi:hypothetical protein [Pinibacter aurantiacus]|uniref:Uncharacterized protein n=1 Tax=Pinibacter aurantiacus TaxID=2851599 RepID=A0A9E2W592_9BACT|nr:hypothetical protein [Pinibacter aurantiacus]MBV4360615.1 hypothetical protein [Pinibacter aurantiacus]